MNPNTLTIKTGISKADAGQSREDSPDINRENLSYRRYHPDMYKRKMSIFWWVHKPAYVRFILRELTSLFVAVYSVLLMIQVNALRRGPEAWESLIAWLSTPQSIVLHVIMFLFLVFHSLTWFQLAPTAMVIKAGSKRVPAAVIISTNIILWILLSAVLIWLITSV